MAKVIDCQHIKDGEPCPWDVPPKNPKLGGLIAWINHCRVVVYLHPSANARISENIRALAAKLHQCGTVYTVEKPPSSIALLEALVDDLRRYGQPTKPRKAARTS